MLTKKTLPHRITSGHRAFEKTEAIAATITIEFAEKAIQCATCGKIILESTAHSDGKGNRYCSSCWKT